jgi:hypothetical protein
MGPRCRVKPTEAAKLAPFVVDWGEGSTRPDKRHIWANYEHVTWQK